MAPKSPFHKADDDAPAAFDAGADEATDDAPGAYDDTEATRVEQKGRPLVPLPQPEE